MNMLRGHTLSSRFALLISVFVFGSLFYGAWSFKTLNELKVNGALYQKIVQGKDLIADILPPPEYILESYLVCLQLSSTDDATDKVALATRLKNLYAEYQTRHDFWSKQSLDATLSDGLLKQAHEPAMAFYKIAFDGLIPAVQKNDPAAVAAAIKQMKPYYDAHRQAVDSIVQLATKRGEADEAAAASQINQATLMLTIILCASLGASILIAIQLVRGLLKRLGGEPDYAAEISRKIADGDLAMPIQLKKDDRSSLLFAMKTMQQALAELMAQIQGAASAIRAGSAQITDGNFDLSARTEDQASALEQTASAMQQLTSAVRQNVDNANNANQMALSASDIAVKGGVLIDDVVSTMRSISAASHRIVDIIGVIDGIAFQTNILALNAAVEAARAGEQGRGFAVVAAEVRTLAQRSASAAKEIKELIGAATEQVDGGARLVDQTGQTMLQIVESVKNVSDMIASITQSSREQATGIEQINQAILQMDRSTQENAALVEQAAATAGALQDEAGNLSKVTDRFRVNQILNAQESGSAVPPQRLGAVNRMVLAR